MRETLITALESGDLRAVAAVPKSDLHNHASNGGNVHSAGISIPPRPETFASVAEMEAWAHAHIKDYFPRMARYAAAFSQAAGDGVTVLAMSFVSRRLEAFGTVTDFIGVIRELKARFAPDLAFLPELSFSSGTDIAYEAARLDEILSHGFFTSVDISGEEDIAAFKGFTGLFCRAKAAGLRLKAHVGEYGTADDVLTVAELLELDEVHHGIAAAKSPQIMAWLARHSIQLNICPTSNIVLGHVKSYDSHPIRALFDAGVPVTLNSDDMLIFDQSVSQEYMNLYRYGLMTASELEHIRQTGLSQLR